MGVLINPGNDGFRIVTNGIYVDKTEMLDVINGFLDTTDRLMCVSRPRRFGKSFAAKMLCAYYDRSCDSAALFDRFLIAGSRNYKAYLNHFTVVYLDITGFLSSAADKNDAVKNMISQLGRELETLYPEYCDASQPLPLQMLSAAQGTGIPFAVIIDEWDAIFREEKNNDSLQKEYVDFLRSLFKNANVTDRTFALVYMTGILPIKKYGTQSALTDFREYTMLSPGVMAPYIGFTQEEVKALCRRYGRDFSSMKKWYDGYSFRKQKDIYNPNSVILAIQRDEFDSFWTESETYTSIRQYIEMDVDGLQEALIQIIGGSAFPVDSGTFQNDMTTIHNRDDVLTLLVHLGYLNYNAESRTVQIPDEEVRMELIRTLKNSGHRESAKLIRQSDRLIYDTVQKDEEAVAAAVEEAHDAGTSPLFYNDEQALRSVVKAAYISAVDQYLRLEELPSGHGFADIVYFPKKRSPLPLLLIELKWNRPVDSAIAQIMENNYPEAIRDYGGKILLVGITYDEKTKKHTCRIKELE